MQHYGVEMYYEFLENLNCLRKVKQTLEMPILVQLHPSARKEKFKLQKLFPEYVFSIKNITKSLKKAAVTISYSSTVIEDSLYSDVPVVLFDQWKRYQHCHAELDPCVKNKAVYYVTDVDGLITSIKTVLSSKNVAFSEYTILGKRSSNFQALLEKLI